MTGVDSLWRCVYVRMRILTARAVVPRVAQAVDELGEKLFDVDVRKMTTLCVCIYGL